MTQGREPGVRSFSAFQDSGDPSHVLCFLHHTPPLSRPLAPETRWHYVWLGLTPLATAVPHGRGSCLSEAVGRGWASRNSRVPRAPSGSLGVRSVSCALQPAQRRSTVSTHSVVPPPGAPSAARLGHGVLLAKPELRPARPVHGALSFHVHCVSYRPAGAPWVHPKDGGQEGCLTRCELWSGCGRMIVSRASEELQPGTQPTAAPRR